MSRWRVWRLKRLMRRFVRGQDRTPTLVARIEALLLAHPAPGEFYEDLLDSVISFEPGTTVVERGLVKEPHLVSLFEQAISRLDRYGGLGNSSLA